MNQEKTAEEIRNMLSMQEEILQFTHFSNMDAIALGRFMVEEAERKGLNLCISIRRMNGTTIFQAMMDGVAPENLTRTDRTFHTVRHMEISSLLFFMQLNEAEETLADKRMDENYYAAVGGGFPIRMEEAGVVGAVCVSGLHHVQDHDFIVRCLSKYLHMDEVPRIRTL